MVEVSKTIRGYKKTMTIDNLFKELYVSYNKDTKSGLHYHEYFSANEKNVKIHFDYDEYVEFESENDFKDKDLEVMTELLTVLKSSIKGDFYTCTDSRNILDNKYKHSFHFVYPIQIKMADLKNLVKSVIIPFTDTQFDTSIYRCGKTKFRIPMCKKENDANSLLTPLEDITKDNFKDYIIQHTDNLPTFNEKDYLQDKALEFIETKIKKEKISQDNIFTKVNDFDNLFLGLSKYKDNFNNYAIWFKITLFLIKHFKEQECDLVQTNQSVNRLLKMLYQEKYNETENNKIIDSYYDKEININIGSFIFLLQEQKIYDEFKLYFKSEIGDIKSHFNVHYWEKIRKTFVPNKDKENNYKELKNYFEHFNFKIKKPSSFCVLYPTEPDMLKRACFVENYENIYFDILGKDKSGEEVLIPTSFIKTWLKDTYRRTYTGIDFLPPPLERNNTDFYNLFSGLQGELLDKDFSDIDRLNEQLEVILKHLGILCGKPEYVKYVLSWLAHRVQRPGEVPQVAMFFRSTKQGVGKNMFFEWFGNNILGEKYLAVPQSLSQVIGKFNSLLQHKLLVIIDETNGSQTFCNNDDIKRIISSDTIQLEKKGLDSFKDRHTAGYVFFSNNETPIKIEQSDRRFVVFDCDNTYAADSNYIETLLGSLSDKKFISYFFNYLKEYDLSNFNFIKDRPITDYYKELQSVTVPIMVRFIQYLLKRHTELDSTIVEYDFDNLYSLFNIFLINDGYKNCNINKNAFSRKMAPYSIKHYSNGAKCTIDYSELKIKLKNIYGDTI